MKPFPSTLKSHGWLYALLIAEDQQLRDRLSLEQLIRVEIASRRAADPAEARTAELFAESEK